MFNDEVAKKIDALLLEKFPMIYEYQFDGIVLIFGGTIRNTIMNIPVNDLDVIILTQDDCQVLDFIKRFKLRYLKNAGGGYKILYNNFWIDINSYNDLFNTAGYDIDFVFYDILKHSFIVGGAINAIENRTITEVNLYRLPLYTNLSRLSKLARFINFVDNESKVKIKVNRLFFYYRFFKKRCWERIRNIVAGNYQKCLRFLRGCNKLNKLTFLINCIQNLIILFIPFFVSGMVINLLSNDYNYFFFSALCFVISLLLFKIISLINKNVNKKFMDKMHINIYNDVLKCIMCYKDNNNHFMNKTKKDCDIISNAFCNIKNRLIWIVSLIIMLFSILYINYTIGILMIVLVYILYDLNRKKRKKYAWDIRWNIDNLIYCMGTYGDMFYLNNLSDETSGSGYKFKTRKNSVLVIGVFAMISLLSCLLLQDNLYLLIVTLLYIFRILFCVFEFDKMEWDFFNLNFSCDCIFSLLDGTIYINELFGNKYKSKCAGNIEFNDVTFRYNYNGKNVLEHFNFNVKSNDIVYLVGKCNSGKSTILNLISRLYHVDGGNITIDGININEYSEKYIRENVAIVSCKPYLFDMSIKDNLRLVDENINDIEIERVCKLVDLDKDIVLLSSLYDTIIDSQHKLSDKVRWKICLIRALLKGTKIILFDDIIDNDMIKIINKIKKNHTIIVALENESFVYKNCKVLKLDSGKML